MDLISPIQHNYSVCSVWSVVIGFPYLIRVTCVERRRSIRGHLFFSASFVKQRGSISALPLSGANVFSF
jgi:hypothetical protein